MIHVKQYFLSFLSFFFLFFCAQSRCNTCSSTLLCSSVTCILCNNDEMPRNAPSCINRVTGKHFILITLHQPKPLNKQKEREKKYFLHLIDIFFFASFLSTLGKQFISVGRFSSLSRVRVSIYYLHSQVQIPIPFF